MNRDDSDVEVVLTGGNASGEVVRIGTTVRKPWLPSTERTTSYLRALGQRGIDVPLPHGQDGHGRLILDFIPGRIAMDDAPLDLSLTGRVGALVRSIHDASAGLEVPADWEVLVPVEGADLLCHNDLATWNLVVEGDRLVFIDWDGAGPSTRLWDLAYAAISFGQLFPTAGVGDSADRLAAFVDGYDADHDLRSALPTAMGRRADAMHELLRRSHDHGREPWSTMYVEGHGQLWHETAAHISQHRGAWQEAVGG